MRTYEIRQQELFDSNPLVAVPALQKELRDELLQLLSEWLYTLGEQMVQENRDE